MNEEATDLAPMTRAQKFQQYMEKGLVQRVTSLPASMAEASVRSLVRALGRRFEILRTSLDVVDGVLRQRLHDSGSPLLVVDIPREGDVQRCMASVVSDFRNHQHGRIGVFLVQFHLLRGEDQQWLAVVADNVAIDAGFHSVLDDEITRILAGRPDTGPEILNGLPGLQPREAAALEASSKGERERAEARTYLRRHFSIAPSRLHPSRPASDTRPGRYYRCTLTLQGADRVFSRVIASTGLLPSALILAAFSQLMCWRSGSDSCSVNVSVDNRHNSELRRVLCATAQRVPVALLGLDRTVLTAAADVQRTLSEGHPTYGRYDPFDLLEERAGAQHRRGICLNTDLAFNFMPPPQGWTALIEMAEGESADVFGPDPDIRCVTTNEVSYEYGASLSIRWTDTHSAQLSVHGDSKVITPSQCEAVLRGIELVLKRSVAEQECEAGEVAREVGVHGLHHALHEQRIRGRWIDLKVIEGRLLGMHEVEGAEIVLEPRTGSGAARLTAHVTVADGSGLTPFDLREELLRAVDTGEVLVTPDWYRITGGATADGAADGASPSGDGREIARRPDATDEESAVRRALEESRLVPEPDLDLCYVRAGGNLSGYPRFADQLRQRGYVSPSFALVSGMSTLRNLARQLRRSGLSENSSVTSLD